MVRQSQEGSEQHSFTNMLLRCTLLEQQTCYCANYCIMLGNSGSLSSSLNIFRGIVQYLFGRHFFLLSMAAGENKVLTISAFFNTFLSVLLLYTFYKLFDHPL